MLYISIFAENLISISFKGFSYIRSKFKALQLFYSNNKKIKVNLKEQK